MSYDPNNPQGQPQPLYGQPPTQYPGATYGQGQPPPYGQPPPMYGQPQYAGPPPGYAQAPQPQKKSLRWLWITLGIVGGVLVLGCAGCLIAGALGFNFLAQAVGPDVAASSYYQAIEQGNYGTAYTYLASNATVNADGQVIPVTQEAFFEAAARAADSKFGKVTSYVPTTGSDTSHVTVTVTRGGKDYTVHLVMVKVGNDWKIQSADGL